MKITQWYENNRNILLIYATNIVHLPLRQGTSSRAELNYTMHDNYFLNTFELCSFLRPKTLTTHGPLQIAG